MTEEQLVGGNTHAEIVKISDTVRRPTGDWTPGVHALLKHLDTRGYDGAPRCTASRRLAPDTGSRSRAMCSQLRSSVARTRPNGSSSTVKPGSSPTSASSARGTPRFGARRHRTSPLTARAGSKPRRTNRENQLRLLTGGAVAPCLTLEAGDSSFADGNPQGAKGMASGLTAITGANGIPHSFKPSTTP